MPIIRNPFRRQDENSRPTTGGAERVVDGLPTKAIDIKEKEQQPAEYKLSEINDSGVFVPPSPPERKSFWATSSSRSTTSSHTNPRSVFDEKEPFNISRESFDSYRRSFDISARSPVIPPSEQRPRASLDSKTFMPPQMRTSSSFHRPLQVPRTQQEDAAGELEDVNLDEPKPAAPKKRGIMSRIMDSDNSHAHTERSAAGEAGKGSSWHHFGGRKRGQSGQGAELGSIPKKEENGKPVESLLRKEDTSKAVESQPRKDNVKPAETQLRQAEPPKPVESQPRKENAKPVEIQLRKEEPPKSIDNQPRKEDPKPQQPMQLQQATPGAERVNSQAPVIAINGVS